MTSRQLEVAARSVRTLRRLGSVRDGLLVVGTLAYAAGYGSWSYYAWSNRLGPLPAVDAQYFLAGVPALVAVLAAVRIARTLVKFYVFMYPRWRTSQSKRLTRLTELGSWLVTLIVIAYLIRYRLADILAQKFTLLDIAVVIVATLTALLMRGPLPADEPNIYPFESWLLYFFTIAFAFAGALFYLRVAYPRIPQVFGGAAPRAARLDISHSSLSVEAMKRLGCVTGLTQQPISSAPLWVYYSGSDTMLVSRKLVAPNYSLIFGEQVADSLDLIQLNRANVQAIHWLDVQ